MTGKLKKQAVEISRLPSYERLIENL